MERNKFSPVAVTVDIPSVGHYEKGQEVILTFHAIPDWMESSLGFAMQAMGWQMEEESGNVVCRVKVTNNVVTFSPARIESGKMSSPTRSIATSDGY
ncbi:MAG: hypothetical protein V1804_04320 [Patescibacteria group bacterium]